MAPKFHMEQRAALTVEQLDQQTAERIARATTLDRDARLALQNQIVVALHRARKQASAVACLTCAMEKAQRSDGSYLGAGAVLF